MAAFSMIGLAFSPRFGAAVSQVVHVSENTGVLSVFAFFWVIFEIAVITAGSVFGALINDVVPRRFLGRFFGLFRAVSLIAGMIFNHWLIGWAVTHFFAIFLGISLLFGIGFTIMCLKVKEGDYPPPVDNPDDPRTRGLVNNVRIYFTECFSHPYYLWVFLAMLFAGLTFIPYNTFSIPYWKQLNPCPVWYPDPAKWDFNMSRYGDLTAFSYGVSLCLAWPLGWLVDKLHSLRVGLAALALYALSVLYGSFFVNDPRTFGVALVAHTVLSGTYFTATASLGQALLPKLKYGQFASAAGLVGSVGNIFLGLVLGPILDLSHHNYRLTFIMGLILCATTIFLLAVVYRNFMLHGGPTGYVAPEPKSDSDASSNGFEVIPVAAIAGAANEPESKQCPRCQRVTVPEAGHCPQCGAVIG
jgi:MFS family permease